jgi:hypothetical protein
MSTNEARTGSSTYNIDKLTETNYSSWAQQLQWILDERNLWDLVNGTEARPQRPAIVLATTSGDTIPTETERAAAAAAATAAMAEYETKLEDFIQRSKKARSTIGASISASIMVYIKGMTDPAEMWRVLEEKYNPRTQTTLFQIIRQFMNIKMGEGDNMEKHLQNVQTLKRKCEEQGEEISDNVYIAILLNSVSEEYKIAVAILESQAQLTPASIINRLMEEYRKNVTGSGGSLSKMVMALLSNQLREKDKSKSKSGQKPKTASNSQSSEECGHCGRKGHDESKCWVKHPELRPSKKGSKKAAISMMAVSKNSSNKTPATHWYIDSGSSDHFSPYEELFDVLKPLSKPIEIVTAEGTAYGVAKGRIQLSVKAGNTVTDIQLNNVLYAPDMQSNLLSSTVLYDLGYEISMKPGIGTRILKNDEVVAETIREGKLFRLAIPGPESMAMAAKTIQAEDVTVWHRRLAHMGEADVKKMEYLVEGVKIKKGTTVGICGSCLAGKQHRTPSREPSLRAKKPGELIHIDMSGQITPTTLDGFNYYGLFIDDATRMTYIAPMKTNGSAEMLIHIKRFAKRLETELGAKIKRIRTDGGSEYKRFVDAYLKEEGIKHEITAPYHPDQNGVVERANRTVMGRVRAILDDAQFPREIWDEVAVTVVYLKNLSPTSALENLTPHEAWFDKKPNLQHLRVLGCTAYVHVPEEKRIKLDSHTMKGQLVGYGGTNQWKVWIPARNEVVTSRDVIFDEELGEKLMMEVPAAAPATKPIIHDEIRVLPGPPPQYPTPPATIRPTASPEPEPAKSPSPGPASEDDEPDEPQQPPPPAKPTRKQKAPPPPPSRVSERSGKGEHTPRYGQVAVAKLAQSSNPDDDEEPTTFQEATTHPTRAKEWEKAIMDEYNSIMRNNSWKLVPRPANRQVVTNKWVFKHKKDQFGRITRLKARLVARGFSQIYGVDYLETYAPVAKLASLRILLAIAAAFDLEIHQMDVVTAFLANILDEEIYMEQPEGFIDERDDEDMVCKLGKSLYGLKQSARLWNQKLHRYLRKIGFTQTNADHCVYINKDTGVIVAMWVDDLIIFGQDSVGVDLLKLQLRKEFEMKDLGELQYFLGMQVHRDRTNRQLRIHQRGYINTILQRFGMQESSPVSTPLATGTKLVKFTEESTVDQKLYQSNVGSQMYAMLCTRPDLAYSISQISQFSSNPSTIHESAAKRVLRYLNGTRNFGITFDGSRGLILEGYSDADWGAGEDRKSISGYVFTLAGGAISWSSKKQATIALSTTEAEYIALTQAAKESIWIQGLLGELGFTAINGNLIYGDNQGSIALAYNPEYHARTKHIDIQYHFIRECVQDGKIALEYCATADMVADGMTKALAKERHLELLAKMGVGDAAETTSPSPMGRTGIGNGLAA